MPTISQETLDAIVAAKADYETAVTADSDHESAVAAVHVAEDAEQDAADHSLETHKTAAESANAALDAVRHELGLA